MRHALGLALLLAIGTPSPLAQAMEANPEQIVRGFVEDVRSGRDPDAAARYFAPVVRAHQVTAEGETVVDRTPDNYAAHVREFLSLFGAFELEVQDLFASGDRVFVRWRQTGRHIASLDGEAPTGKPLIELTSVVYRIEDGRIAEYWLQTDRKGLEIQLERAAAPN